MSANNFNFANGKLFMRYLIIAARIILGLIFFVFGLNGFFHFIPQPKDAMPPGAMDFFGALMKTGYMIPLIFATQTLVGALLLLGVFVPLALTLIAPVIVNIILFHACLAPTGYAPAIVVSVLEIFLVWAHRKAFRSLLAFRAKPD
ncbi:MAG TPA: DoxX family membrane protein [Verrucomicrobiae bacterium]|nr:DoxX family membrane protein [Verrucomicrobiae bacterium]